MQIFQKMQDFTHTHTYTQDKRNDGEYLDCIQSLYKWGSESLNQLTFKAATLQKYIIFWTLQKRMTWLSKN